MSTGPHVTSAGLLIPSVESLVADCEADQRTLIDPKIDMSAESPIGNLNGIFCSHLRECWEVVQIAYNGENPDAAEGFLLDAICALTGSTRQGSAPSKLMGTRAVILNLNANTTVPANTLFHVAGDPRIRFKTLSAVTSTTAGAYTVDCVCTQDGPINCNAGTLTEIVNPVVGLNSVSNPFDAELGQNQAEDQATRQRREAELRASGAGTVDALRSDVLAIKLPDGTEPVISCVVFQNMTMITNPVTGLPPKSVEVLIYDGLTPECPDNTLAQTVWDSKPAGIELYGTSTSTAIDKTGAIQPVKFSRATIRQVKFNLVLKVDSTSYGGDQAAKTAIANRFIAKVHSGSEIRCADYIRALMTVPGVLDVPTIQVAFVGNAYGASHANITLGLREQGDAETSDMVITTTPGIP